MSRDLNDLSDDVRLKALLVMELCDEAGFELLIYCTLRSLQEQARLYRQSRPWSQISIKIDKYRNRGFGYLANVIEEVGPCNGPYVTNAAPGESWHNYAEAWDAVPILNGKAAWSYGDNKHYWDIYGKAIVDVGMQWAGHWTSFVEYAHAQLRSGSNPLKSNEPDRIEEILKKNKLL